MQMVATGSVASLREARDLISTSFPARVFEPKDSDRWGGAFERFRALSANSTD
jgi:hypothetical protein